MKRVQGQSTENTFNVFGFETLSENEMNAIKGGTETKPKTRPKDVFDIEEEG